MGNPILNNLNHPGAYERLRGIIACVDKHDIDQDEKKALILLTDNKVKLFGITIGQYARAALHILGIETSNDKEVLGAVALLRKI